MQRDPRHQQRGEDGSHVGSRVEDAGGQRALAARKPFGHGLDRGREISRLAQAEGEACQSETPHAKGQRVSHRRKAPRENWNGIAVAGADQIDSPPEDDEPDGIGGLKRGDDVAVLHFAPADLLPKARRENAENLPVEVIDRRRGEEQRTDRPAEARHASGCLGWRIFHEDFSNVCKAAFIQPRA